MVSGVVNRDGNIGFSIEVDAERGPKMEPLRKAAEVVVSALPGVLSVTAVLTAPAAQKTQTQNAPHTNTPEQAPRPRLLENIGAVVAIASG